LRRECDSGGHRRSNFGQSPLVNDPMMRAYLIVGAAVSTVVILAVDNVVRLWGVPGSTAPFLFTTWTLLLGAYSFTNVRVAAMGPAGLPMFGAKATATARGLYGFSAVLTAGRGVRGRAAVVPRNALSCRRNGQGTVPLSASRPSHVRTS
jgi:urea transporter